MNIKIEREDLRRISSVLNNDSNRKKAFNIFKKEVFIYSSIYVSFTFFIFSFYMLINRISLVNSRATVQTSIIYFSCICLIFYLSKRKIFKDKNYKSSRYNYLLDNFQINIDLDSKIVYLISDKTKINIKISKENIKISNNTLLLLNNNDVVGIIPLYKISEKEYLLESLKELIEVENYEF